MREQCWNRTVAGAGAGVQPGGGGALRITSCRHTKTQAGGRRHVLSEVAVAQVGTSTSFQPDDDEKFMTVVSEYLEQGAERLRGLTAEEYVEKCRTLWRSCETDEVFEVKLLIDKLILARTESRYLLSAGLEEVTQAEEPPEDLYCVALGLMRPDGSFVGAPEGYDPTPPTSQSYRSVALALENRFPVDEPLEPEPATYVLALLDVLGFSRRLTTLGLARMHELYRALISVALEPFAASNQWTPILAQRSAELYSPGLFWLPIRYSYFSDSILLWIPYHPELVEPFLDRVMGVFCEALRLGLPLRGAVAAGTAILHKATGTFLGEPLVEAERLHGAQQWVGVACGVSVRSEVMRIPFSPLQVMLYDAPVKKPEHRGLLSGLVLDWPRRWRHLHGASPQDVVSGLRAPGFEIYYDTAADFVRFSEGNSEWFAHGQPGARAEWSPLAS